MAYPAGVRTRQISFGAAISIETAEVVEMRVNVKSSRSLVWTATGVPLISIGATYTAADGLERIVTLPVTDQSGWSDGQGSAIDVSDGKHSHAYVAGVEYLYQSIVVAKTILGPFVLPTGSTILDIDNLLPMTGSAGGTISIPDTWSQQIAEAKEAVQAAMDVITNDFPNAVGAELARSGSPARNVMLAAVGSGGGEGGEGVGPILSGTTPPTPSTEGRFYIQKAAE